MRLYEMLRLLMINSDGLPDRELTGVTCSTDKVKKDSLFFAINGEETDGHRFVSLALEKGAAAAVGQEALNAAGYVRTDNSRRAHALAQSLFWGRPQEKLKLCGVTGTNGKTTVTAMIRSAAVSAGLGCGLIGTVNTVAGGRSAPSERTTPGPEELYPLFREMADSGDRLCVMEVSSHALATERVHGLTFDAGVFTNLTRDHLDFHKTMDAYARAKGGLMENSRFSAVNADDPRAEYFLGRAGGETVTYGIEKGEFRARDIVLTPEGVEFTCPLGQVHLPPGGRFSVYNGLAAACGALGLGIPEKSILRGLNLFQSVPGRLEKLKTKGKYNVYIDYAHTPDGLEKVLRALREFAPEPIVTVFGCGGDRDKSKRPMMGEIASTLSDLCVVTSDNPRTEEPMAIIDDILAGINGKNAVVEPDRRAAIGLALRSASGGGTVLLAGKGHETYQIVGREKLHMDERELVAEIENEMK